MTIGEQIGLLPIIGFASIFFTIIYLIGYFFFYRGPFGYSAAEADILQVCSISLKTRDGVGYEASIEYVREHFGEKCVTKVKEKLRALGLILPDDLKKKTRHTYLRLV